MPSCTFDTCCGCIELKTGCLIIGYLNLVSEIILIIVGLMGLATGGVVAANGKDQTAKNDGVALLAISVILLLIFIFLFAFTIVFLVGIHKNKRGYVKVYLIVSSILLVIAAIMTLAGLSQHFNVQDFISRILSYLLSIYFLLVIRSYYYKMDDKRPAIYNTA